MELALIFSAVLGGIHFWNEKIFFKDIESKARSMSFIGGVAVSYVFLFLLPELFDAYARGQRWIFLFLLFGFSTLHVAEKYFYRHLKGWKRAWREKEIHYLVLFMYYLAIGTFSVFLFNDNVFRGILFFLPVLFYSAVGKVSFAEVDENIRQQYVFRFLISIAAPAGVILGPFLVRYVIFYDVFLAFIIGSFLYIALMDFIPARNKGKPSFFIIGASVCSLLILLNWVIVLPNS